ncbi:MAG: ABC transporter ATP-binding protein [Bacteroidales bacterium]|nr:ABC transporter ATP-binding protein [Bacteroidales bacterium]
MDEIIKTENISKCYGDVHAVSDLSLNVRKSEIYGFLGLNGAGKTTTIRMLLGMIRPTSGTAFIYGKRVYADNHELWKNIGSLVEIPYSYPNLTVHENLDIIRRLRFISDKGSIEKVIDKLRLASYKNIKAKNLSLGNAQRLGLAKAMLHNPEILILDEPTNGLDPAGIYEIREMLSDLATNHGVTIFISSHILGEISRFSTRIGIIHEGKLIQEVDTSQLDKLCRKHLLINARDTKVARSILIQNGFNASETKDGIIEILDEDAIRKPENIATVMVNAGCPPTLLQVEEEDLESYFLRTIGINGGLNEKY